MRFAATSDIDLRIFQRTKLPVLPLFKASSAKVWKIRSALWWPTDDTEGMLSLNAISALGSHFSNQSHSRLWKRLFKKLPYFEW